MKRGIVYIAEDDEGIGFLSGLFSAHWEPDDGSDQVEDGPEAVTADEALTWGRARADVVLIRVGEEGYRSAGVQQPTGQVLPEWPTDGMQLSRRRAPSNAYLDRTENDPPIAWELRIAVRLAMRTPADFTERLVDALYAESRVSEVSASSNRDLDLPHIAPSGDGPLVSVRFHLHASTYAEAIRRGEAASERAAQIASSRVEDMPDPPAWWISTSALPADISPTS